MIKVMNPSLAALSGTAQARQRPWRKSVTSPSMFRSEGMPSQAAHLHPLQSCAEGLLWQKSLLKLAECCIHRTLKKQCARTPFGAIAPSNTMNAAADFQQLPPVDGRAA